MRHLSKEDFSPRRLLSKETFVQGDNYMYFSPRTKNATVGEPTKRLGAADKWMMVTTKINKMKIIFQLGAPTGAQVPFVRVPTSVVCNTLGVSVSLVVIISPPDTPYTPL